MDDRWTVSHFGEPSDWYSTSCERHSWAISFGFIYSFARRRRKKTARNCRMNGKYTTRAMPFIKWSELGDGNECWTKKTNSHLEKRLRTERTSITQQEISVGALLWMSYKQYYYYYCCCIRANNNNNNGTIGYNVVPIAPAQRYETNEDRDATQHTHTQHKDISHRKRKHRREERTLGARQFVVVVGNSVLYTRLSVCYHYSVAFNEKKERGRGREIGVEVTRTAYTLVTYIIAE